MKLSSSSSGSTTTTGPLDPPAGENTSNGTTTTTTTVPTPTVSTEGGDSVTLETDELGNAILEISLQDNDHSPTPPAPPSSVLDTAEQVEVNLKDNGDCILDTSSGLSNTSPSSIKKSCVGSKNRRVLDGGTPYDSKFTSCMTLDDEGRGVGMMSSKSSSNSNKSTSEQGYHHYPAGGIIAGGPEEDQVLKQLVNSAWCGLLAALSTLLEACTDEAATENILQAFQVCGGYVGQCGFQVCGEV